MRAGVGLVVLVLFFTPVGFAAHEGDGVPFADSGSWKTDFRRHSVPLREIREGGPPRDGIPAVDRPRFDTVPQARGWLRDPEPVVVVKVRGEARAYPVQILIWHEIVNDVVAGEPLAVTFCPLCNAAIAFRRRAAGRVLDFGTTGKLRYSDLVMYDRQTESWWQQMTGEAIVGELVGTRLESVPAQMVAWAQFARAYPQGRVLNRDTGFRRAYGRNPYVGYDDARSSPFLYDGPQDRRLRPMERVVAVTGGREAVAYPFEVLKEARVVNDRVGSRPIVVVWAPGVASAVDRENIAGSRDVGAVGVFERVVAGRLVSFRFREGRLEDGQAGSAWDLFGRAVQGPLRGWQLKPVVHGTYFWFAWAAFRPDTRVYRP
ncbi:MAG: DUF3179 domain-containing protein [Armatimonadota bacterium]|nr:DUF3179 domain-containing protein [Armatimonadota bacterium]MDR7431244.1 DUF3179 domain-containing protein [Armatimonadota bacterium]MDR7523970.1 DUF3179 domain-containing protein [Armatimonadota bacterium]MDR7579345.1 DUF3179 domain-containing protein [Armatimonadota bacterium]MDR7596279.1 DUF3179 domain-containing protein [Armatimonadota bacterium]